MPDLELACSVLEDFTTFWSTETEPDAKRHFLTLIFEGVWLDERRVVAVQPKPSFLPFFESRIAAEDAQAMGRKERERRETNPRLRPRISRYGCRHLRGAAPTRVPLVALCERLPLGSQGARNRAKAVAARPALRARRRSDPRDGTKPTRPAYLRFLRCRRWRRAATATTNQNIGRPTDVRP